MEKFANFVSRRSFVPRATSDQHYFAYHGFGIGVETQRQWSDKAIQRSTPLLMAMYSILTLIALKMNTIKALVVQETASWYDKQGELTFADIIVIVRRDIWTKRYLSKSANQDEFEKFGDQEMERLIYQLSLTA